MLIKKYYQFINESRSEVIKTTGNYIDVIKEYAHWYLEHDMNKVALFRGIPQSENFLIIEPKKYKRKPLGENSILGGVPEYYSLIMDGSPDWLKFTDIRRYQSIFASNSKISVESYGTNLGGDVYRVIPLKRNTNFVISTEPDTFGSFNYINRLLNTDMIGFSDELKVRFGLNNKYNNLSDMKSDFLKITIDDINNYKNYIDYKLKKGIKNVFEYKYENTNKYPINNGEDLFNWVLYIFSPELNLFDEIEYNERATFKTLNDYTGKMDDRRELYTNEPCLLIKDSLFN